MGPVAYTFAIHTAKSSAAYYIMYGVCCVVGGFLLSKFCKCVYKIIK